MQGSRLFKKGLLKRPNKKRHTWKNTIYVDLTTKPEEGHLEKTL
jgi:hypothetical protein